MLILPVIDLMDGYVVLGRSGQRHLYEPIASSVLSSDPSSPQRLAGAIVDKLGLNQIYVADLDAIGGAEPAWDILRTLGAAASGQSSKVTCWLDAGVGRASQLSRYRRHALSDSIDWVVGLETLESVHELRDMLHAGQVEKIVVSLDLKNERPLCQWAGWQNADPFDVAGELLQAGVQRLIVLDLLQVGTGQGTGTLRLIERIRHFDQDVQLVAGGGICNAAQVRDLDAAGADGVLLATSLHNGEIGRDTLDVLDSREQ